MYSRVFPTYCIALFTFCGKLNVSCVALGDVGSIRLSVTDSGIGFCVDSSCGGGSSGGSSYILFYYFIYVCAHCVLMTDNAVC